MDDTFRRARSPAIWRRSSFSDLGFVRGWVEECDADRGRPSVDPVAFEVQLVMLCEGARSECQLIATASLNPVHLAENSCRWRVRVRPGPDAAELRSRPLALIQRPAKGRGLSGGTSRPVVRETCGALRGSGLRVYGDTGHGPRSSCRGRCIVRATLAQTVRDPRSDPLPSVSISSDADRQRPRAEARGRRRRRRSHGRVALRAERSDAARSPER